MNKTPVSIGPPVEEISEMQGQLSILTNEIEGLIVEINNLEQCMVLILKEVPNCIEGKDIANEVSLDVPFARELRLLRQRVEGARMSIRDISRRLGI